MTQGRHVECRGWAFFSCVAFFAGLSIACLMFPYLASGSVASGARISGAGGQGEHAHAPAGPDIDLDRVAATISVAERNTAWATYILTAVGILFAATSLVTVLLAENRFATFREDWRMQKDAFDKRIEQSIAQTDVLRAKLDHSMHSWEKAQKDMLEDVRNEIWRATQPLVEYMIEEAQNELVHYDANNITHERFGRLHLVLQQGAILTVRMEPDYRLKEKSIRRLSRAIAESTISCLDELGEKVLDELPFSTKKADLRGVIQATRQLIQEAIKSVQAPGN